MTRDRFDVFSQHCADVGLTVTWRDLGPKRRGQCQCSADTIVLNPRMTLVQAASTGVHEFGHWAFGDRRSTPINERRAWEYGASLLIEPCEYAAAEGVVGCHPNALALELGVTVRLVEAWRRWWLRQDAGRVDVSTHELESALHDHP